MQRYIIVRLFHAVIVLFAVSIVIFGLTRITGNPLDVLLPEEAFPEDFERVKEIWGLDKPLHVQYLTFLGNALRGNFGDSIKWPGRTSRELVLGRLPATLQLAAFALLVSAVMALPIGVIAAVKKDTGIDYAAKLIALLGQSLSSFWLGIVLIWIFAFRLDWFPTSGKGGIEHMVLPAIPLGWYQVAAVAR
jgi:peptide/nickel transport system permease protein